MAFLVTIIEKDNEEKPLLITDAAEITPLFDIEPDSSGDFAVFINGALHGRFEDMGDAERFVKMSREVIEREGLGDDVGLYMIIEGREEWAEEEDEDFDEDDIDNWEYIG